MKKTFNSRIVSIICLVIFISGTISCKKDDTLESTKVELLSYGPAGVKHGEQIRFIGKNLDKVTAIKLTGATVAKAEFIEQSSELIIITVPQAAERGVVTLETPDGDVVSKAPIDFEVPVKITSIPATIKPGDNLTITGEFLHWVTSITFADEVVVTEFVSKSSNQITVTVPMEARTGALIIATGGTEPLTIESEEELNVILPAISTLSPNPVEREADLTITGTNLDLTEGILFKGTTDTVKEFVSKTATQLVVKVPAEASGGAITLVTYSDIQVKSPADLEIDGDLPPLAPLGIPFYIDGFESGWGKWGGWGAGSVDVASTEKVRDGAASIKVTFADDWGGPLQFGGGNSPTSGYSKLVFSIFGTAGTNGKKLNATFKGGSTESKEITVVEGEWTEYQIPLSDFGNPANITESFFQSQGWAGIIYVDHIGLR